MASMSHQMIFGSSLGHPINSQHQIASIREDDSDLKIKVWWDLESVKCSSPFDPLRCYMAIKTALKGLGFVGELEIKAYAVRRVFDSNTIKRLDAGGVNVQIVSPPKDIPLKDSQVVDTKIKKDVDNCSPEKSPYVAVLMTCDGGYLEMVHKWIDAGLKTVLVYCDKSTSSALLGACWHHRLRWDHVERDSPQVDPVTYNLPRYGVEVNFQIAPCLISVQPSGDTLAITVGSVLRIFNLRDNIPVSLTDKTELLDLPRIDCNIDAIRSIGYGGGETGNMYFVTGDDAKRIKVWSTKTWDCICIINSKKGVVSVSINKDGNVCYVDKKDCIYLVDMKIPDAHKLFMSGDVITSMHFLPDDQHVVSADKRNGIRVNKIGEDQRPIKNQEIVCNGHLDFITCLAISQKNSTYLLSGSRDSTVRLWDVNVGKLLGTYDFSEIVNGNHTIIDICIIDSYVAAVAIQSLQGIVLLSYDSSLSVKQVIRFEETFIPTSISASKGGKYLWMVSGASRPHSSNQHPGILRVKVIEFGDETYSIVGDEKIPGGKVMLEHFQSLTSQDEEIKEYAEQAMREAMSIIVKKGKQLSQTRFHATDRPMCSFPRSN